MGSNRRCVVAQHGLLRPKAWELFVAEGIDKQAVVPDGVREKSVSILSSSAWHDTLSWRVRKFD